MRGRREPRRGHTWRYLWATLVAAWVAAWVGCGEEPSTPPPLPFSYSSAHLELHSDSERCGGDLAQWDGFVDFAAERLGVETLDSLPVYVWEPAAFDGVELCGFEAGGCFRASEGVVYTSTAELEHEIVHVLTQGLASSDSFFDEGLAEAMSGRTQFGQYPPYFPVSGSTEVDYASAGHFVRWLIETEGLDQLLAYMDGDGSIAAFEARYGGTGGTLADITAAYFEQAAPRYRAMYRHPWPSMSAEAGPLWSSDLEVSCAAEDVRSTRDGYEVLRELSISEAGTYAFWTSMGGRIRATVVDVVEPGDAAQLGLSFMFAGGDIGVASLPAGSYEIAALAPAGVTAGTIHVWANDASVPVFPGAQP